MAGCYLTCRLGERLDVAWAIDVLHPLATEPAQRPG
jgi:hypothetical protein